MTNTVGKESDIIRLRYAVKENPHVGITNKANIIKYKTQSLNTNSNLLLLKGIPIVLTFNLTGILEENNEEMQNGITQSIKQIENFPDKFHKG